MAKKARDVWEVLKWILLFLLLSPLIPIALVLWEWSKRIDLFLPK